MNIGFIGIGHMGGAIIEGWIKKQVIHPQNIFVSNRTVEKRNSFTAKTGVQAKESNLEVAVRSDLLFIAAKPADFPAILNEISSSLSHRPVIVSIAAGIPLSTLECELAHTNYPVIRVMPNLNHRIGEGMAAVCANEWVEEAMLSSVVELFGAIGETIVIPEDQFSIFSAIAGCSPAFTFTYIDSLARAAVRHGFTKEAAVKVACQAVLGSAKLALDSSFSPMDLADQVASPGGTTIEGVLALADTQFVSAIVHAVDASYYKDQQLLKENKEK